MCGLAGLFDTRGTRSFDEALVRRMTQLIAHRGPDGEGVHLEPGLALGHRRLAIIDLGGGAQPMSTPEGDLTVVFNGEIYNFMELRTELIELGARFATRCDTEVLLHGWRHWREAMLPRLNGMFAFALWDAREQTLFMARDRFGKKPLHYGVAEDGVLAFGSEIKSLLSVSHLDRSLSNEAISDFFTYGYIPDPKSIYRSIRKLPPAHYLKACRGRDLEVRAYWSVLDQLRSPQAPGRTEELVERLERAVRQRLVADVPLGALLSGGVDSSAVVALMASGGEGRINTFSIGFEDPSYDESGYAKAVADRYRTDHRVRLLDPDDFSLISRLPDIYDEPFGDISALPTFAVCAEARRSVTVALSGDGGDEALGGYRRYAFHQAEERIRAYLPRFVRRGILHPLAAIYPHASWAPRPLRAKSTLRELSLDPCDAYAAMVSALPPAVRQTLLTPDFLASLGGYDSADVVREPFNVDAPLDSLQRAQYADLMTYLPGDILTKVDRASMANSLELRSPMLDPDFYAWAFSLPASDKIAPKRGGKAILKAAMEPYLPNDLLYRPKQGFTVPLARWLRGPLREQMFQLAESARLRDSGVVNLKTLASMAEAHADGRRDHSKALWLIWVFDAFLGRRQSEAAT
jgi:asparagine synthase (glutamine-hydrolysing)